MLPHVAELDPGLMRANIVMNKEGCAVLFVTGAKLRLQISDIFNPNTFLW
jgi:hypothetical protein